MTTVFQRFSIVFQFSHLGHFALLELQSLSAWSVDLQALTPLAPCRNSERLAQQLHPVPRTQSSQSAVAGLVDKSNVMCRFGSQIVYILQIDFKCHMFWVWSRGQDFECAESAGGSSDFTKAEASDCCERSSLKIRSISFIAVPGHKRPSCIKASSLFQHVQHRCFHMLVHLIPKACSAANMNIRLYVHQFICT